MHFTNHSQSRCLPIGTNEFFRNTILSREYYMQNTTSAFSSRHILFIGNDTKNITECAIKPNLLQTNGSYVILDVNGEKLKSLGQMLKNRGYELRILDYCSKANTHTYNPFLHLKHKQDVQTLIDTILGTCKSPSDTQPDNINNMCPDGYQTCVETAAGHLLRACVYYLINECNQADQNLYTLKTLIESAKEESPAGSKKDSAILTYLFASIRDCPSSLPASNAYKHYRSCCPNVRKDAILLLLGALQELHDLWPDDSVRQEELYISDLPDKKIAVFLLAGEKPQAFEKLYYSLFLSQLFDLLLEPVFQTDSLQRESVKLFLDDMRCFSVIPDLARKLFELKQQKSDISVFMTLNSIRTLNEICGEDWEEFLHQMDFQLYFPSMDDESRKYAVSLIRPQHDTLFSRFVKNLRNGIIYHSSAENTQPSDILLFYRQEFIDKVSAYPYSRHPRYYETADYNPKMCYTGRTKDSSSRVSTFPKGGDDV